VFFDVSFERDEMLVNEVGNSLIRVGLGLQPSASASSRSSREINQQWFVLGLGLSERGVHFCDPIDEHRVTFLPNDFGGRGLPAHYHAANEN
jgi:hypothetical protein